MSHWNLIQNSLCGGPNRIQHSHKLSHKNHVDKSEVPKLAPVSYTFSLGSFSCPPKPEEPEPIQKEDNESIEERDNLYLKIKEVPSSGQTILMGLFNKLALTRSTRGESLDERFEL